MKFYKSITVILIVFNTFFFNSDTSNESQKIKDDNIKNNSKPISNNDFDNVDNNKSKVKEANNLNDSLRIKNSLFAYYNEETEILDSIENEKLITKETDDKMQSDDEISQLINKIEIFLNQ